MSRIEWCDHSVNVVDGCSPASPGCDHCYAARMRGTRQAHQPCSLPDGHKGVNRDLVTVGKTSAGGLRYIYNGRVSLNREKLARALEIPFNGGKAGRRVFWNFQSDTFHEALSASDVMAQFAIMAARPDLRFLVLTKRPEQARAWFELIGMDLERCQSALREVMGAGWMDVRYWPKVRQAAFRATDRRSLAPLARWQELPVALGVSAEDQQRWDARVPVLLDMKERGMISRAFVSAEPLLGPIDPRGGIEGSFTARCAGALRAGRYPYVKAKGNGLDQLIIGAESGPGARMCPVEWVQGLGKAALDARKTPALTSAIEWIPAIDQIASGGPALFIKQAPACPACFGRGTCAPCHPSAAKVRKGCPRVWIDGYGDGPWSQHMEGF